MPPVIHRLSTLSRVCLLTLAAASAAQAQIPGLDSTLQNRLRQVSEDHVQLIGDVEITTQGVSLLAEMVDYYTDTQELVATGNVVFSQTNQRVAAERLEYNLGTNTGTFYIATGQLSLGDRTRPASMFGTQEPDVLFYGEQVEKLGSRRYKITRGGFTTCVQPTPRWEMVSGSVVLNLDQYAILTNSVFKVKGVPLLYLPVFYYPINREDRATGVLIPQYGSSTIRGQSISNAFFWAINRSHDATFTHDWFTQTGQGTGGEYRYVTGPTSRGTLNVYYLNEHEATYQHDGGGTVVPARRSYEVRGEATQDLGAGLRARGRVDYFSDITVQQTYHTDIYQASRRSRVVSGGLTGSWGAYNLTGGYDVSETFFGTTSSAVDGTAPSVTFSRGERPIGPTPVYFSFSGNYSRLVRETRSPGRIQDKGLDRVDIQPEIRLPFTRWPFLTVNSSLAWRNTYWSESLDATGTQLTFDRLSRRYFDFRSEVVGPVFSRIFDTPDNGYAERFKHTIEPFFRYQRRTAVDVFNRIIRLDRVDSIVGNVSQYTYGLNNRLYAKRQEGGASMAVAREIASVSLTQTYYTDAQAAQYDQNYRSSFSDAPPSNFSPVSIEARFAPTLENSVSFRAEYDTQFWAFRSMGADARIAVPGRIESTIGWSQKRFIERLRGYNNPDRLDHFLNQSTLVRSANNTVGVLYAFNYDVRLRSFLQQRIMGYYNAQCCGIVVEYQTYDLSRLGSRAPVAEDRRFNISFTLAGIGSFSNFFGALGGAP